MNELLSELNSDDRIQGRRYKNNMIYSGMGFIVFGAWTAVRSFMTLTMNPEVYAYLTESLDRESFSEPMMKLVIGLIFALFIIALLLVHVYIGRSAIKYAKGKKKSKVFLVFTAIVAIYMISSLPDYFDPTIAERPDTGDTGPAAFFVDMTMLFMLVDMLYSAFRLWRLKAKKTGEASE